MKYDHKAIEPKWQEKWEETGVFHAENGSDKPKYYALIEFPYPSGQGLHVGHPRPYTALDVVAQKAPDAGLQRAVSHRLGRLRPAHRELRHQEPRASRRW